MPLECVLEEVKRVQDAVSYLTELNRLILFWTHPQHPDVPFIGPDLPGLWSTATAGGSGGTAQRNISAIGIPERPGLFGGACEGRKELARWNRDLWNTQGPSHSKHAGSPQTNACFSTTHGFNWRAAATAAAATAAVSANERKKKRKKPGRRSSTNLIIKSEAGRQIELAASFYHGWVARR